MRNFVLLCLYVTVNGSKLKNKLCRGKTCRQCDNYVTANSQKTNDRAYQFCSRLLSYEDCCKGLTLNFGFVRSPNEKQCFVSDCSDKPAGCAINGTDMFSYTLLESIEDDCKNNKIAENADCKLLQGALDGADVCMKNLSQRNFLESNAAILLLLTLSALVLLSIGTFTLMKHHRQQLHKIREYRQGYGTADMKDEN